jgi:glycosyltransferase involved in cell wall biosynthesis
VAQHRGGAKYVKLFLQFCATHILSKSHYHILHVHYFYPTMLFAIAYKWLRNPKVKIICTFQGSDIYLYQRPSWLYRWASKYINKAIFVSEPFKTLGSKIIKAPSEVLCVGASEDHCESDQNNTEFDLLFVGNLNDNKGSDRLIKLIEQLPSSVTIGIAGQGHYKTLLEGKNNVTCLGALLPSELIKLYQRGRYLLNLSRNESFGLCITEAMLCGLPVIATQTDGSNSHVGELGIFTIVPNDDNWLAQHLAARVLTQLAITDAQYKQMSQGAVHNAQQYKISNVASKLASIYLDL